MQKIVVFCNTIHNIFTILVVFVWVFFGFAFIQLKYEWMTLVGYGQTLFGALFFQSNVFSAEKGMEFPDRSDTWTLFLCSTEIRRILCIQTFLNNDPGENK